MTNPIYPPLNGLTYPVVKTPMWSTLPGKAASGREVRLGLYSSPLWQWTLVYDVLFGKTDLQTLIGFFCGRAGSLLPFQFKDPDDNTVIGNIIGETDGTTTTYQLTRIRGVFGNGNAEPIGVLDTAATFNVYLNGTLQAPSTYTLNTATPVNQMLVFDSAPTTGQTVSVDMSYYFWVRFGDDQYDFSKFMDELWEMKKVVLMSLRN